MKSSLSITVARIALIAASASACPALAQSENSASSSSDGTQIREIIVTAQKREQSLQDVPVSVTALSGDALTTNRITTVADLGAMVPNLKILRINGGSNTVSVTLRGSQAGGSQPGVDRQVAFYLDGVWIGSSSGSAFDLPDIERMEVLRGPQGTLFGRNSTAGAISITTRDPAGEFGFRTTATAGNYNQFRSSTRVDTPSFGPFSASISYTHDERRGEVRNLGAGTVWDRSASDGWRAPIQSSPEWLDSKNSESIFVGVKFEPSDNFKSVYKFDWVDLDSTPNAVAVQRLSVDAFPGIFVGPIAAMLESNPVPIAGAHRPKVVNNAYSTWGQVRAKGHNLTSYLTINDRLSFKNILAYRESDVYANSDFGIGGLQVNSEYTSVIEGLAGLPAGTLDFQIGSPFVVFGATTFARSKQWSEELQLNYDSDLLTLTAGVTYIWLKDEFGGPPGMPAVNFFKVFTGGVVPASGDSRTFSKTKSLAGYAQAEVHLTPELDVVGGIRITRDDKNAITGAFVSDYKDTRPTYTIGANYRFSPDVMVYAKFAHGYISGGSQYNFEFGPEFVDSWEAGLKGEFLDRRLRLNIAVWDAKYDGLQQSVLGATIGRPEIPLAYISLGDVHAQGFEAELTAVPVRGLTLAGGFGYTHTKLSNLSPSFGTLDDYRLTERPTWSGNASIQYDSEPLFDDATLMLRVDGDFKGSYNTYPRYPNAPEYAALEKARTQIVLNARAALKHLAIGSGELEIAGWVRNLTDFDKPTQPYAISTSAPTNYAWGFAPFYRARTYGLDLTFSY